MMEDANKAQEPMQSTGPATKERERASSGRSASRKAKQAIAGWGDTTVERAMEEEEDEDFVSVGDKHKKEPELSDTESECELCLIN
jgi:hypothetical protein